MLMENTEFTSNSPSSLYKTFKNYWRRKKCHPLESAIETARGNDGITIPELHMKRKNSQKKDANLGEMPSFSKETRKNGQKLFGKRTPKTRGLPQNCPFPKNAYIIAFIFIAIS